jgi:hypothetical protein
MNGWYEGTCRVKRHPSLPRASAAARAWATAEGGSPRRSSGSVTSSSKALVESSTLLENCVCRLELSTLISSTRALASGGRSAPARTNSRTLFSRWRARTPVSAFASGEPASSRTALHSPSFSGRRA